MCVYGIVTVKNETFATNFPFILTQLGIWKSCRRMTQTIISVFSRVGVLHDLQFSVYILEIVVLFLLAMVLTVLRITDSD